MSVGYLAAPPLVGPLAGFWPGGGLAELVEGEERKGMTCRALVSLR